MVLSLNVLDYIILAFTLVFVIISAKKGFISKVLGSLRLVASIVTSWTLAPKLSTILVDKWLGTVIHDAVYNKINEIYTGLTEGFDAEAVLSALPDFLVTDSIREALLNAEGEGADLVTNMANTISGPFANLAGTVIAGAGLFVVAFLVYKILVKLLEKIFKSISLLNFANVLLGGAMGVAELLLIYLFLFSFFGTVFSEYELVSNSLVIQKLSESGLLQLFQSLDFKQIAQDLLQVTK